MISLQGDTRIFIAHGRPTCARGLTHLPPLLHIALSSIRCPVSCSCSLTEDATRRRSCTGIEIWQKRLERGTHHRHELDVQEYLRDVIDHMNRGTAKPSELLPDVWKASHPKRSVPIGKSSGTTKRS